MLSRCFLDFSVGVEVFVKGLSQISSYFSYLPFARSKMKYVANTLRTCEESDTLFK